LLRIFHFVLIMSLSMIANHDGPVHGRAHNALLQRGKGEVSSAHD